MKSNKGALPEIWQRCLLAVLKYKKISHNGNEGKSAFQAIAINYINNKKLKKKKKKNEQLTLVISSIRLGIVSSLLEQTIILLVSF